MAVSDYGAAKGQAKAVAVSCGDPAGVGPELAVAAWKELGAAAPFIWIGDPDHLPRGTNWAECRPEDAPRMASRSLPVLPLRFGARAKPGQLDTRNAAGVVQSIDTAVTLVADGTCSAVCTLPIHKKALQDGTDFPFPGHTEYLAHLAGGAPVAMMLASPELRVVPATIHIPLAAVPAALSEATVEVAIRLTAGALKRDFGVERPRIAVAGLNPHAGEGGNMGREEIEIIIPVLDRLRGQGFDLIGPLSADTMFHPAARKGFDAAVCMYHDQALIPIKTVDFAGGVNVTLGLPIARTSPDHGTALDIAGTGRADPTSFVNALLMAADMGARRASKG